MKKGINQEYDLNRNNLFEIRFQIEMIKKDPTKKEELEKLIKQSEIYLNNMKRIEIEYAKEKTR